MNNDKSIYRSIGGVALATACLLLVPLAAKLLADDFDWKPGDFVAAAVLLFGAGLTYVLVSRQGSTVAYRVAVGIGVATSLFLVWVNLAVGIIGSEDNPVNVMYAGVFAIGFLGAILTRLQPRGMTRTLLAMAVWQALVPVIALVIWKSGDASMQEFWGELTVWRVFVLNAFFVTLFVGSALLFRQAAEKRSAANAIS